MSQSLKWAFMRLAENTFYTLEHCRRVKHQIQEETLTDLNMLNLKRNHSTQLTTHTFSKHEEGKNGGDWEWWLTNSSRKRWLMYVRGDVGSKSSCVSLARLLALENTKPNAVLRFIAKSNGDGNCMVTF